MSTLHTSGAIQAALPRLFVIMVDLSATVPKSQIFRLRPLLVSNKLSGFRSRCIRGLGDMPCRWATPWKHNHTLIELFHSPHNRKCGIPRRTGVPSWSHGPSYRLASPCHGENYAGYRPRHTPWLGMWPADRTRCRAVQLYWDAWRATTVWPPSRCPSSRHWQRTPWQPPADSAILPCRQHHRIHGRLSMRRTVCVSVSVCCNSSWKCMNDAHLAQHKFAKVHIGSLQCILRRGGHRQLLLPSASVVVRCYCSLQSASWCVYAVLSLCAVACLPACVCASVCVSVWVFCCVGVFVTWSHCDEHIKLHRWLTGLLLLLASAWNWDWDRFAGCFAYIDQQWIAANAKANAAHILRTSKRRTALLDTNLNSTIGGQTNWSPLWYLIIRCVSGLLNFSNN